MTLSQWRARNSAKTKSVAVEWVLDYDGHILSLNDYNKPWQKLRTLKQKVSYHFAALLLQNRPPKFEFFELYVLHNTRLDMDNVTGMIKPCIDVLRKQNVIDDDNAKNWDKLTIQYEPALEKNVVRFRMVGYTKKEKT